MAKNIDDKIVELMAVLKKKQEEVKTVETASKKSWNTNCAFPYRSRNEVLNIQTATLAKLRVGLVELFSVKNLLAEADKFLGLEVENKYEGYTWEQWQEDFKTRLAVLQLREKKDELAKLEVRLNAIVSPEQRRQMELDEITKALEA